MSKQFFRNDGILKSFNLYSIQIFMFQDLFVQLQGKTNAFYALAFIVYHQSLRAGSLKTSTRTYIAGGKGKRGV